MMESAQVRVIGWYNGKIDHVDFYCIAGGGFNLLGKKLAELVVENQDVSFEELTFKICKEISPFNTSIALAPTGELHDDISYFYKLDCYCHDFWGIQCATMPWNENDRFDNNQVMPKEIRRVKLQDLAIVNCKSTIQWLDDNGYKQDRENFNIWKKTVMVSRAPYGGCMEMNSILEEHFNRKWTATISTDPNVFEFSSEQHNAPEEAFNQALGDVKFFINSISYGLQQITTENLQK